MIILQYLVRIVWIVWKSDFQSKILICTKYKKVVYFRCSICFVESILNPIIKHEIKKNS